MKRYPPWEIVLELLGNAYIIAAGLTWLVIFVIEEARSVWEPNAFIRRAEMVFSVLLIALGVERLIRDLRHFMEHPPQPDGLGGRNGKGKT